MKEGMLFLRSNVLFCANVLGNKVWGDIEHVFILSVSIPKCELISRLGKEKRKKV